MKIAAIAFSERGAELGATLELPTTRCPDGGLADWTALHFNACDALVFIGSCGIAVRAIAPHVHCKASDPAVVVVDELGTFAIALLSGHLGGANALTATLATKLNAMPVVTTATDIAGVAAVDVWAQRNGFAIANLERVKRVSARLLNTGGADAYISFHASDAQTDGLRLIPRIVTLGIGCRRGVTLSAIESAVAQTLDSADILPEALRQVCSIDLKASEPALLEFCRIRKLPLRTFTASELMSVHGEFSGSALALRVTGADNVCERAAVLGSGGTLLSRKLKYGGVTTALAVEMLISKEG